jgi:hypothetical protein
LPIALGTELALERAVAFEELRRLDLVELWPGLLREAHEARVGAAIAAPYARYLRSLNMRSEGCDESGDVIIDVPLRLFPRVQEVDLLAALTTESLDEALALEIAAVASGRVMTEWVLAKALEATR